MEKYVRLWYNIKVKALLLEDAEAMNTHSEPERFCHSFVLGLMAGLPDRYMVTPNRESGIGRHDVILEPRDMAKNDAIILDFEVQGAKESSDMVSEALRRNKSKR